MNVVCQPKKQNSLLHIQNQLSCMECYLNVTIHGLLGHKSKMLFTVWECITREHPNKYEDRAFSCTANIVLVVLMLWLISDWSKALPVEKQSVSVCIVLSPSGLCVFYDVSLQSQVSEVLAASDESDTSWPFDMEGWQSCGNIDGFSNTWKGKIQTSPSPVGGKKLNCKMWLWCWNSVWFRLHIIEWTRYKRVVTFAICFFSTVNLPRQKNVDFITMFHILVFFSLSLWVEGVLCHCLTH